MLWYFKEYSIFNYFLGYWDLGIDIKVNIVFTIIFGWLFINLY